MLKGKKLLVIILIFAITFSYFAEVTEAMAAGKFISLFSSGKNNINFNVVLNDGENSSDTIFSDVNNENLSLDIDIELKEKGYLKNVAVNVSSIKDNLNFAVVDAEKIVKENKILQKYENNTLSFNNIKENVQLVVPIQFENEEYINLNKLNNKFNVELTGIFVTDDGDEYNISKNAELQLSWKDDRDIKIESDVTKYIQYANNGVILQTYVKVNSLTDKKNTLPVKESQVIIDVPYINEFAPSEISVVASSTNGTNGKDIGETEFTNDNWKFYSDENKIKINVENEIQNVNIVQEDYSTKEEQRYYNVPGIDEYIITYTYKDLTIVGDTNINTLITANVELFNGNEEEDNTNISSISNNFNYQLNEQTGNVVSINTINNTPNVSKVYGYLNNGTEIEYLSKTSVNISSTDFIENIYIEDNDSFYTDKNGTMISTSDLYYKDISVSKEDFDIILGENGQIDYFDENNNLIATINKDSLISESGDYVVQFENRYSKVIIKLSKPINMGNIVFENEKCISNVSLSKAEYKNISSITSNKTYKLKLDYVTDIITLGTQNTVTVLDDTTTDITFSSDRNVLSTATTNSNVEFKIGLNNNKLISDIYGHTVIEMEIPNYITNFDIIDTNLIYGEGLVLSDVSKNITSDGNMIVRFIIDGMQSSLNSGIITNGTNIVMHANIDVNKYLPSINTEIKCYVYNSESTNYANAIEHLIEGVSVCGYTNCDIEIVAPDGVVAINSISNYNKKMNSISSVKEGTKKGMLDILESSRTADVDLVVINNNDYEVSNISILGRIPFKGAKDLATGQDLKNTFDVKLTENIQTNADFIVYYSENGEADNDLSNAENGWTTQISNFENVKSYMIVPIDNSYALASKQVLKFTYKFEIPENLEHNENIYHTFVTYYNDKNVENAVYSDMIELTTGIGPKIDFGMICEKETLNPNEEFEVSLSVKNEGEQIVENINVLLNIPEQLSYISATANRENVVINCENNALVASVEQMAINSSFEVVVKLRVNINSNEVNNTVKLESELTADGLGKVLNSSTNEITINKQDMSVSIGIENQLVSDDMYLKKGSKYQLSVVAQNLTEDQKDNVKVKIVFPKEIIIEDAYIENIVGDKNIKLDENASDEEFIKAAEGISYQIDRSNIEINENANIMVATINTLDGLESKSIYVDFAIGEIDDLSTGKTVNIVSSISANNTDSYNGNSINLNIGKESISISQTSDKDINIEVGDEINFIFKVKNEGKNIANEAKFIDYASEGIYINSISYKYNGEDNVQLVNSTEIAEIKFSIPAEAEIDIVVNTKVINLGVSEEITVSNYATIETDMSGLLTSNSITHIAKNTYLGSSNNDEETKKGGIATLQSNSGNSSTKLNKISGVAWIDENEDGARNDNEQKLSNINVLLMNSDNGMVQSTTTTNDNGEYEFKSMSNGSYIIVFKYDTKIYTTTTYKKQNIDSAVNSDAFATQIEQNGKSENAAVTDKITMNGTAVNNVDIGLVKTKQFSLAIDNSIKKITVQNSKGTNSVQFENKKLAKYEIAAKQISESTVYIEYTIVVKNNGDLTGFATELVDYIPEEMSFNSSLNPDWYTGTDGYLHTKALSSKELSKGDTAEITLILTKEMTSENTGLISNTVEIASDYNIYGVSDNNSTPGNKAQSEDDISTADAIITVKTGEKLIVSSIIVILIVASVSVGFISVRTLKIRKKGGDVTDEE